MVYVQPPEAKRRKSDNPLGVPGVCHDQHLDSNLVKFPFNMSLRDFKGEN